MTNFNASSRVRMMLAGVALIAITGLAGCANQSASGNVYSFGQAQRAQSTLNGTVLNVRHITIQPSSSSGVGAVAGAAVGGIAGSGIGGGSGRAIASVLGGLAGGLAGNTIEQKTQARAGYEVTVRLDDGQTRVVAQEADIALHAGQRVQIVTGSGVTRVIPAN